MRDYGDGGSGGRDVSAGFPQLCGICEVPPNFASSLASAARTSAWVAGLPSKKQKPRPCRV
jgi:hypothetical protein